MMDSRASASTHYPLPATGGEESAWRFTVAPVDASVPQIRRAVRALIRERGAPISEDLLHGLLLILSELVTNGVRHAALLTPEIGVEVAFGGGWVRVSVEDRHPYRPTALYAEPDRERIGGRGLLLVREISGEAGGVCGVEPVPAGGKVVWAAVPMDLMPLH
ncbi:ATP-binding protein [Streptomyces sp. ST2-7A]|uniref:ATP-binding protein n=1 Tax=Streptomyces sp. ST2-7A TaxID=2907214 RepID=UPI001F1C4012|nr:ATP-binding protein [Streptomyces sp. ST2-7A]MCE7081067.1 ATP-binding protein [Streptomyces sp. ST2-7A]